MSAGRFLGADTVALFFLAGVGVSVLVVVLVVVVVVRGLVPPKA
jgi:hypothetical protein